MVSFEGSTEGFRGISVAYSVILRYLDRLRDCHAFGKAGRRYYLMYSLVHDCERNGRLHGDEFADEFATVLPKPLYATSPKVCNKTSESIDMPTCLDLVHRDNSVCRWVST